ncbi:AAA family ATPase [Candidatus Sumerlaeota bacterium]|nr:AAA family ATPase [Candidatus Sumerlaeota bacterium]MBI3736803.1 AAA family ATPase [Candidatus Sumerlaeota bacterium]
MHDAPTPERHTVTLDNIELMLSHPDVIDMRWIGSELLRDQLVAAWMIAVPGDIPLNPRLVGKPGIGKTTLAYAVARAMGREVYIFQCTMDTRPEDLLITPVISKDNKIAYHASSLVTAMIRGGVCILDEGNRMSEKSWASLAPLLDQRRYIESIVTGLKIKATPEFRICCTMNDDASTYEVPEYIQSRLQPMIEIGYPDRATEQQILKFNVPYAPDELIEMAVDYLQKAHRHYLRFTSRDGINILRFCVKLGKMGTKDPRSFFDTAIEGVLGHEGVDFMNGIVPASAKYHRREESYDPDEEDDAP